MSDPVSRAASSGRHFVDLGRVNPQTGTPMLQPVCRCQSVPRVKIRNSRPAR